jgi:hypothetical protein
MDPAPAGRYAIGVVKAFVAPRSLGVNRDGTRRWNAADVLVTMAADALSTTRASSDLVMVTTADFRRPEELRGFDVVLEFSFAGKCHTLRGRVLESELIVADSGETLLYVCVAPVGDDGYVDS